MAIEFDSIRPLLNISDDRIQAARSALVDNETYQAVANRYGWTRQAVGDSVDVVWRTLLKYRETPMNLCLLAGSVSNWLHQAQ